MTDIVAFKKVASTFTIEIAEGLLLSKDDFPVSLEAAALWLGIRTKKALGYVVNDLIEGVDYTYVFHGTEQSIYLTTTAFKEVGMMVRTERGRLIRKYFIECESRLKKLVTVTSQTDLVQWQEERRSGKVVRRSLTDMIKIFIQYAEAQGASNGKWYYTNFSNLINKFIIEGYPAKVKHIKDKRDRMVESQLRHIKNMEDVLVRIISDCMDNGDGYHDIYDACRNHVAKVANVLYISPLPLLHESNQRVINQHLAKALKAAA
jgi:phage anti-repressor protein